MNPEIFAEWMRRQGHRVFRTTSSYWYEAGPHILQAFPYHWLISPSEEETNELMTANKIISLRYSTFLNSPVGKISYHIILHNPYNLQMLKSHARNSVKRGLSHCTVEQITFERLATEGWLLQQDTLDRQNRLRSMTQSEWERICRSAFDLPGFEAWAAVSNGELAAALIVCQIDNTWCAPYSLSHRKFLNNHVNNALFYSLSRNLLARDSVEGIFFTVQSLDAPPSVDDFKLRMGLIPKPVRQRVEFHPWLRPVATPTVHRVFTNLLHHDTENPLIAKAEGMLRFYVEGKQPFTCQPWPECLVSQKDEMLNGVGSHN
jgi:hypothetical protein